MCCLAPPHNRRSASPPCTSPLDGGTTGAVPATEVSFAAALGRGGGRAAVHLCTTHAQASRGAGRQGGSQAAARRAAWQAGRPSGRQAERLRILPCTAGKHPPYRAATFNVKTQFGAKGDGRTDDTRALQRAVAAACDRRDGGVVYLPAGGWVGDVVWHGRRTSVVHVAAAVAHGWRAAEGERRLHACSAALHGPLQPHHCTSPLQAPTSSGSRLRSGGPTW